jgi:hypothetical protein
MKTKIKLRYYLDREKINYLFEAITNPSEFIESLKRIEQRIRKWEDF